MAPTRNPLRACSRPWAVKSAPNTRIRPLRPRRAAPRRSNPDARASDAMFRNLFRLLVFIVVALVLRQVVAAIVRGFSQLAGNSAQHPPAPRAQSGGELKKDPVCG